MSFLRRLLRAGEESARGGAEVPSEEEIRAAEHDHEREVARAEAERLDELRQRQLRYAQHAWTPPRQGGERRADDEDARAGE